MSERLKKRALRVVGARQVLRGIRDGALERVVLALDAAPQLRGQIERAAAEAGVPLETAASMEELARLCRVDVPSAAAGILRPPAGQNAGK